MREEGNCSFFGEEGGGEDVHNLDLNAPYYYT